MIPGKLASLLFSLSLCLSSFLSLSVEIQNGCTTPVSDIWGPSVIENAGRRGRLLRNERAVVSYSYRFEKYQVNRCGFHHPNVVSSRVEFTFQLIYRSAITLEIALLKHRTWQTSSQFASEKATVEQDFEPGTYMRVHVAINQSSRFPAPYICEAQPEGFLRSVNLRYSTYPVLGDRQQPTFLVIRTGD
jgi:hypothetical protein